MNFRSVLKHASIFCLTLVVVSFCAFYIKYFADERRSNEVLAGFVIQANSDDLNAIRSLVIHYGVSDPDGEDCLYWLHKAADAGDEYLEDALRAELARRAEDGWEPRPPKNKRPRPIRAFKMFVLRDHLF